jgi:hypothetical protein
MLSNATIGGLIVAMYITIVCLQLNPRFPLGSLPALATALALSYGLHFTVAFYVLIVVRQLLASEVLSPGWISFRVLVWLVAVAGVIGSALMWANLRGFRPVMDAASVRRMTGGAAAVTVCAAVAILLVVVHRWSGRRSTRWRAIALGVVVMASLAASLTLRGPGLGRGPVSRMTRAAAPAPAPAAEDGPRVTLLLFEGASLDIIVPAAAAGRLPHFERILNDGASMHVATLRPTQPTPVWAAAATGKLPAKNGIRSAATYTPVGGRDSLEVLPDFCFAHALVRFGFLRQRLHGSQDLAAAPVWRVLGRQGIAVGIVNWPLTYPALDVPGYLVSEQFEPSLQSSPELAAADIMWPPDALGIAPAAAADARGESGLGLPDLSGSPIGQDVLARCGADWRRDRVAAELDRRLPARFRAIRYECLDAVGHYFLRQAIPNAFGDVTEDELHRFGNVLPSQYGVADGIIGRELAALRPGDLLLVLSGFGMEPVDPGKRLLERAFGNPSLNGSHERAPDGFLLAFGTDVQPGHLARASIADVAPTILYFLGVPVAHDMDGHARTDMFQRALTEARPIIAIPTHPR